MKIRLAKKILKYSKRDHLAEIPEFIKGYSKRTLKCAERRYIKWWNPFYEIGELKED